VHDLTGLSVAGSGGGSGGAGSILAVNLAENSKAQVDGDVDQTAVVIGALLAVSLAENSQADIDRDVDQRVEVEAWSHLALPRAATQPLTGTLIRPLEVEVCLHSTSPRIAAQRPTGTLMSSSVAITPYKRIH
jgi:hypothetical protein